MVGPVVVFVVVVPVVGSVVVVVSPVVPTDISLVGADIVVVEPSACVPFSPSRVAHPAIRSADAPKAAIFE
ncbi:hypothetical protein [uncultured Sphingomonas sp.]|uniref:hypothetical protein n=1 Tax=uncultured Sphingomonas sp. TaxID=158754 RepID=UPI0025EA769E|nr:hypothetical protein [uncultured Sphingomonas sp.]